MNFEGMECKDNLLFKDKVSHHFFPLLILLSMEIRLCMRDKRTPLYTPHTHTPHTGRSTDVSFRGNVSNHKGSRCVDTLLLWSQGKHWFGPAAEEKNVHLMEGSFGYRRCRNLYIRIYSRVLKPWKEKEMGFRFTSRLILCCELKWIITWLPTFHSNPFICCFRYSFVRGPQTLAVFSISRDNALSLMIAKPLHPVLLLLRLFLISHYKKYEWGRS